MHSGIPYLTVIVLGVVVSVCPCSVAANVSVLTCVLRQSKSKYLSVVGAYVVARSVAYVVVGWLLMSFVEHICNGIINLFPSFFRHFQIILFHIDTKESSSQKRCGNSGCA